MTNLSAKVVRDGNGSTLYMYDIYTEKVHCVFSDRGRIYPYRWDKKLGCWNECSDRYTIGYIRQLEKAGKVINR